MKLSKLATALWMLIALLIPIHAFSQTRFIPNWSVSEFQPNLKQGGRTNTVAVNPMNRNEMFAASDSGGLFKSIDGGLHWAHIDYSILPVIFTQSVAYVPADPRVVLVSTKADFKTVNGGDVWRSTDGGMNWAPAHLDAAIPLFTGRLSAYEISASGNDVVVGTSEGVFVSTDGGATWTYSKPFSGDERRVFSVLLTPGAPSRIYAGGPLGISLGTLPLGPWVPVSSANGIVDIRSIHAFGRSALSPNHAFVVPYGNALYETEDRGTHWTQIVSAPRENPPCAGTPFIKTALKNKNAAQFLYLYYGNSCGLHRLIAPAFGGAADFSGAWEMLAVEHYTRDLALFQTAPVLLATNGGLHNTADLGLHWTYVGGGSAGYNALQVTGITGQFVGKSAIDLYFGTQDNGVRAVDFMGNETGHDLDLADGLFIEAERRVRLGSESRVTYVGCAGCTARLADRYLQNVRNVVHGTGWPAAMPVLIGRGERIENVRSGLDVTTDPEMMSWQPFASFTEVPSGLPKPVFAGADGSKIIYQAYVHGSVTWLMQIEHSAGNSNVVRPAMSGLGTMVITRTIADGWYPVYDPDRGNRSHVIAIDNQRVRQTTSGGETWDEIPGLTDLVTDNGRLRFRTELVDFSIPMPLVTAISFFPGDPSQALIGTADGGIYYSADNGMTWGRINGSERATYVTSFFWANINTVFVSTFGRGVWKLRNQPIALPGFGDLCGTCTVISNDGGVNPAFAGSALAFDGQILGVRTEKGQLREVLVTPGSSVVFTGDPKDPQEDIAITESDGKETFEALPKGPDGWVATGVVFTSDDMLTGTAFAPSEMSLTPTESEQKK